MIERKNIVKLTPLILFDSVKLTPLVLKLTPLGALSDSQ